MLTVSMQLHVPTMDKIHAVTGELTREACIRRSNATMSGRLLFPGAHNARQEGVSTRLLLARDNLVSYN
jgi:hypothetical protein